MSSPSSFRCQHTGRSSWDTHPSCVTCRIREGLLCSRDNPCVHCQDWTDISWHNQDLRVQKVHRDWVAERKLSSTPSLSKGATSTSNGSSVIRHRASPSSIRSDPAVVENPLGIPREALDRALFLSQPRSSRPSRRATTAGDETLSLYTLALFEAAASLSRPITSGCDKPQSRHRLCFMALQR